MVLIGNGIGFSVRGLQKGIALKGTFLQSRYCSQELDVGGSSGTVSELWIVVYVLYITYRGG
jgi:hypothetical protein